MIARWGRFGRFLACSGFPECRNTRPIESDGQEPEATDETCDVCSAPMTLRGGRYGRFFACSRYPDCRGTKPLLVKAGVACPKDGGELVERKTRRRRIFYGCANYPRCDFTSWSRPLPEPCPSCKGLLVSAGRGRRARCSQCDWRGVAGEPELAQATA